MRKYLRCLGLAILVTTVLVPMAVAKTKVKVGESTTTTYYNEEGQVTGTYRVPCSGNPITSGYTWVSPVFLFIPSLYPQQLIFVYTNSSGDMVGWRVYTLINGDYQVTDRSGSTELTPVTTKDGDCWEIVD